MATQVIEKPSEARVSADPHDVAAAAARFADARDELFDWYRGHGRDLLWRRTRDPYAVWVSEIMLQQTTVAAVTPFFERFVGRFPTVADLAAADEDDVLAHWAGLGYYRRARHLHAAAKVVVDEHGGEFPRSVEGLHALPGVGRYTAGAIASFAFGLPAPIVEANTVRLFARLLGEREVVTKSAAQKRLWAFATRIVADAHDDGAEPATLNHAVMELGGAVCTPQNPDCVSCAMASACVAYDEGLQDAIPRAAAKKKPVDRVDATLLVRKAGRVLVRRRGPDEWWAGLWDFPRYELPGGLADATFPEADAAGRRSLPLDDPLAVEAADFLAASVRDETGIASSPGPLVGRIKHGVTVYRITLQCLTADATGGRLKSDCRWVTPAELEDLALSSPGRRVATRFLADG